MEYDSRVEIELLKKDVTIMASLCEKFDTTIDKMQEIASNLSIAIITSLRLLNVISIFYGYNYE